MDLRKACLVKPGAKVKLTARDPGATFGLDKEQALADLDVDRKRLFDLQYRLYAEKKNAVLVVFQAMDTAGKDGAIRHVMTGLNPQGCQVASFKKPTEEEMEHDFLWRVHKEVPRHGEVGIFNRSHYEDVLVVRVHRLVPKSVWRARYKQINDFENMLVANNVVIVKFFLHISKDEQKQRLQQRLDDPNRNWKVSLGDFEERKHWDDYQEAYEDAMAHTNSKHAPWYIVPANQKWVRNAVISEVLVKTLKDVDPKFPKPSYNAADIPARF